MNDAMKKIPLRAQELIDRLGLLSHPEGGYYRETYRGETVAGCDRGTSTMIYFLLTSDDKSHFHRIDADEGWHHYEGDPIRVHVLDQGEHRWVDVGRLDEELRPQALVPAGLWFGAEVLVGSHGYALVGCTVAPAFEFSRFELAERERLLEVYPSHRDLIERLT